MDEATWLEVLEEMLTKEQVERIRSLLTELADYKQSFELYDSAIRRGTKIWQEETGKTRIFPDTAKLVAWLIEKLEQAEAERVVQEGESAGDYVRRRIMDIFQEVAEHVGNEVFDLDHPAPIIRGSIVMTNAWNKYLANLRED